MFDKVSHRLHARSALMLTTLQDRLARIFIGWMALVALACAFRLATAPTPFAEAAFPTLGTYLLLIFAPIASALLALRWFDDGGSHAQPALRLARVGRWRTVDLAEARRHPLYGTSGIMVSLLVGMLLNAAFRIAEFLLAMPPVTHEAPGWVHRLQMAMAIDAVLFSSLYVIAFITALKRVPLFPRLLALIWIADIAMQLAIAGMVGPRPDLPPAAATALLQLLTGAVQKVLISLVLWSPYLLLSKRVNVTYRLRVPA